DDRFSLAVRRLSQRGRYRVIAERLTADPAAPQRDASDDIRPRGSQIERLRQLDLAVNGPGDETDLRGVDQQDLRRRVGRAMGRGLAPGESIQREGAAIQGRDSWKWLMAAALACLVLELPLLAISHAAARVKPTATAVGAGEATVMAGQAEQGRSKV